MFIRALAFLLFLTQFVLAQQPTPIVPDPNLTPGDTFDVTSEDLCVSGYTKKVRNVPAEMKLEVYEEYGITSHGSGDYEVDHLIALELGGSNSIKNLWPESHRTLPWNVQVKDRLESKLHQPFVLSIIAMAKHHVASGVIMMILVLTVPPICILGVFAFAVSKGVQKVEEDKRATIANLIFEDVSGSRDGSYMYLKGRVRNNGTTAADFIKVQVSWLDKQGTIIDTGETFVSGLEKLQSGAAKSFEIMTRANPKMARFSYKFASN